MWTAVAGTQPPGFPRKPTVVPPPSWIGSPWRLKTSSLQKVFLIKLKLSLVKLKLKLKLCYVKVNVESKLKLKFGLKLKLRYSS